MLKRFLVDDLNTPSWHTLNWYLHYCLLNGILYHGIMIKTLHKTARGDRVKGVGVVLWSGGRDLWRGL